MEHSLLNIKEVVDYAEKGAKDKLGKKKIKTFIGGILSGIFIALGALSYFKMMSMGLDPAVSLVLSGILFSLGLVFVLILGSELFTSNILITIHCLRHKGNILKMLKNWIIVWSGNLIGILFIAGLITLAHVYNDAAYEYIEHFVLDIKFEKEVITLLASSILCNIIVCTTVLLGYAGKTLIDKIAAIVLGITVFVVAGFEHIIANMFYFSAYFMHHGITVEYIQPLITNLVVVSIGNIIGGIIVSCIFNFYTKK